MKNNKYIFIAIIAGLVTFLGKVDTVSAQTCGGYVQCCFSMYDVYQCSITGEYCTPGSTACRSGVDGTCNYSGTECDGVYETGCIVSLGVCRNSSCYSGQVIRTNTCDWIYPTNTPLPTAINTPTSAPPGSMWCGNCDASPSTCGFRDPAGCAAVSDTDGDGACEGNCSAPSPTTAPSTCSGISYNLTPASPEDPNSPIIVDMNRNGASSCSGNWNNVNLQLDGVNQGIIITGPTTYRSNINSGAIATHTLTFTVNNGSCICNSTTFETVNNAACSFDLTPITINGTGQTGNGLVSNISTTGGSIARVDFTSGDTGVATVTSPDTLANFRTTATAQSIGSTNYSATATMNDVESTQCGPVTGTLDVTNPTGWWQVLGGDVLTHANISSQIPISCDPVSTSCLPYLINYPAAPGLPATGIATYASGTPSYDSGNVSENRWSSKTNTVSSGIYNYDYFRNKLSFTPTSIPQFASLGDLTSGVSVDGYHWVEHTGSTLELTGMDIGSNKIVIFVDPGDTLDIGVNINGPITLTNGTGFLLIVSKKDIFINANNVAGPSDGNPELEGIFVTDTNINTGSRLGSGTDLPLHIRGSLIALQGTVNLQRDLTDNSTVPGELVEYAPDLFVRFPIKLSSKKVQWKEVAP